jgi:hypothetical protein
VPDVDPFWGDPGLREQLLRNEVKGNLVAARRRYVERHHGQKAVELLAERLDGTPKEWLLRPPLPMRWCSMVEMARLDQAIVEGPMAGELSRMRAFGREIATYDLSTLYKVLFRVGTPGFVLRNIGVAYRTYIRSPGRMSTESRGSRAAEVRLTGAVMPAYLCTHGVCGWLEAALLKSGAREPRVEHSRCAHRGEACAWSAAWD